MSTTQDPSSKNELNTELVSVIIPCFMNASTIERAIKSVIAQSYPYIEIIVVNDCSNESNQIEAILLKYPQVLYIRNLVNVGLAASRNIGVSNAKGKLIAFLDADDEYLSDKIFAQVNAMKFDTVVTCGLIKIAKDGRRVIINKPRIIKSVNDLLFRNTLNGAGILISKDLFVKIQGYDASLRSCEDFDLWLRLLSSCITIIDIGSPLYVYYYNSLGLSKNLGTISKWEIEVIKYHAARMDFEWRKTFKYSCIIFVWLLRAIVRSELVNDIELRQVSIENAYLLSNSPIIQRTFLLITRSRLLFLPVRILRWKMLLDTNST